MIFDNLVDNFNVGNHFEKQLTVCTVSFFIGLVRFLGELAVLLSSDTISTQSF